MAMTITITRTRTRTRTRIRKIYNIKYNRKSNQKLRFQYNTIQTLDIKRARRKGLSSAGLKWTLPSINTVKENVRCCCFPL